MSELKDDAFTIDSDKQLRIRVDSYLGGIGIYQIIGTKEYLEIVFVGGECSIRVPYSTLMEKLNESIEKDL